MPLDLRSAIANRLAGNAGGAPPQGPPGMIPGMPGMLPPQAPPAAMPTMNALQQVMPDVGSMPQGSKPKGNPMDPRGTAGIMSRGSNIYSGGLPQAQSGGGPQFGRPPTGGNPMQGAIGRRLGA